METGSLSLSIRNSAHSSPHPLQQHPGHKRWATAEDMRLELPEFLELWETTLDGVDLTDAQKDGILGCTGRPIQWWRTLDTLPEVGNIDEDMDKIKSMLHGSSRNEMRRRINLRIRYREDLRRAVQVNGVMLYPLCWAI